MHIQQQITHPQISEDSQENVEQQPHQTVSFKDLDQANPILPPGTYPEDTHKPRFNYRYIQDRNKFNHTSFASIHHKNRNVSEVIPRNENNIYSQSHLQLTTTNHQFQSLMESKTILYQRTNNIHINYIKDQTYYSSIFFNCKITKSKHTPIYQHLGNPVFINTQDKLTFNSRFEGANLFSAVKCPSGIIPTYELYLQNDTNTKGCTQWFYFSVQSKAKGKVKFRIMNFYKASSLYSAGMKVICSHDKIEWRRTGISIEYGKKTEVDNLNMYSLEFIYDFDTVIQPIYFAYGFPYNYSTNLSLFLNNLTQQTSLHKIFKKQVLCESNMGNNVYILSINDNQLIRKKPMIYIIGRQHPGETPSSYIIEGILNFLLSGRLQAEQLRKNYHFKIVPMVNVDGVVNGNYRSNCSGSDVNRQWDFPSKRMHPEVYHLKQQIVSNKKHVVFFLDIHAHSRKMNSFFYGCRIPDNENKFYPFVCSKLCKFISYDHSSFGDDPSKKTTARVIIQNQLQLKNSLTFQASFYGWEDKNTKHHFKINDLHNIGQSLGLGLFYTQIAIKKPPKSNNITKETFLLPISKEKQHHHSVKLEDQKIHHIKQWRQIERNCEKMYSKWKKIQQLETNNEDNEYSDGSSVDPQHFQLKQEEEIIFSNHQDNQHQQQQKHQQQLKVQYTHHHNYSSDNHIVDKIKIENNPSYQINPEKYKSNFQRHTLNRKILPVRVEKGKGQQIIIKGQKQTMLAYPSNSNLRNSLIVKQLQSQLQIFKIKNQRQTSNRKNKIQQYQRSSQFKSLQNQKQYNYRYNILEMKKALRYFLETKNTQYDQYKQCFKSYRNQQFVNLNLNFSSKRNIFKKK